MPATDQETARALYTICLTATCPIWRWAVSLIALRIKGEGERRCAVSMTRCRRNAALNATGSQTDADCHPYLQRRANRRI